MHDGRDEETEVMEAELAGHVFGGGYAHVENVLIRLRHLQGEKGHREAVRELHREVFFDGT